MKLVHFPYIEGFCFRLCFEDGSTLETDLSQLIKEHVCLEQLSSAKIDPDWGCLEFNEGRIDIKPETKQKKDRPEGDGPPRKKTSPRLAQAR